MIGGWRGFVPGAINSIAAYCQAGAILFLLLGAKITDDPAVSGPFVGRTSNFAMKKHVSMPLRFCISWNRHPILFAKLVSHTNFVAGFLMRCQYSRTAPVSLSMMAPRKWVVVSLHNTS